MKQTLLVGCFVLAMLNGKCPKEPVTLLNDEKKLQKQKIEQLFSALQPAISAVLEMAKSISKDNLVALEKKISAQSDKYWEVLGFASEEALYQSKSLPSFKNPSPFAEEHFSLGKRLQNKLGPSGYKGLQDKLAPSAYIEKLNLREPVDKLIAHKDKAHEALSILQNFDTGFINILQSKLEKGDASDIKKCYIITDYVKSYLALHRLIEQVNQTIKAGTDFNIYKQQLAAIRKNFVPSKQILFGKKLALTSVVHQAIYKVLGDRIINQEFKSCYLQSLSGNVEGFTHFVNLISIIITNYNKHIQINEMYILNPLKKVEFEDIAWLFIEDAEPPAQIMLRAKLDANSNYIDSKKPLIAQTIENSVKFFFDNKIFYKESPCSQKLVDGINALVKELNGKIAQEFDSTKVALAYFNGAEVMQQFFNKYITKMQGWLEILQLPIPQKAPQILAKVNWYKKMIAALRTQDPKGLEVNGKLVSWDTIVQGLDDIQKEMIALETLEKRATN